MRNKVILSGALLALILGLIAPQLAVAKHHYGGETCCTYPTDPAADSIFERGLDNGTSMAQAGDAPPIYDDCVGDGGNQATYGNQVGAYCSGLIQGYTTTSYSNNPQTQQVDAATNMTNMTTTSQPQTHTTGSFVGEDFGDFHNIPLIGGLVSRSTGVLHNEQGVFIPWKVMCPQVQQYLVEPCSSLMNPDGTLTSHGDREVGCIRNGLAIAIANAHTLNLPFGTLRGLLGGLAGATGCGGIVNLNQIQNTNIFQLLLHSVNIGP